MEIGLYVKHSRKPLGDLKLGSTIISFMFSGALSTCGEIEGQGPGRSLLQWYTRKRMLAWTSMTDGDKG